jgi:vanillate O-demethylase ferredoxin subunit
MLVCFSVPVQVYSGFSPYIRKQLRKSARSDLSLKLIARRDEAEGVCSFEFADPKGRPLPAFSAGSHIDVMIAPGLTRRYSLCNDPKETHRYLIAVLRTPDSRGGSAAMHETLAVGDVIQASLPRNHFPLAHAAERSLLIAGGIGITPILCMAERLSNTGADFALHYAMRSRGRGAFVERIVRSSFASRTQLHIDDEGSALDIDELLRSQTRSTHIYVCGPVGLIEKVVETALGLGWPEALLHREYFVAETHDASNDKPFDVKIASSGQLIHVPKDCSVTEALARAGVDIPTSCSEGVCGTCLTRVLEGAVEHHDRLLTSGERARNDQFTPCCSRAAGSLLVLDL